ncbi:hypothetical protein [Georgenia muralis]|uniref:Glycosyl transferase family 2 n=1 Tax=Georgenia muralis TaxID=154117 RepID=A0A3N4Z1I5_9MICO|nr:hypothetical protein [Georgenia muralis]RPF26393.1 hypothetical protein EDD32_0832 [Georgenia muralis]
MKRHAYVLAGDPAWLGHSVGSYYPFVDRIIVSYDRRGLSWSGHPMSVSQALERVRWLDRDAKVVLLPGDHSDPDRPVLQVETEQRQRALDAAGEGADWVLQLDTDEVPLNMTSLLGAIDSAHRTGADGLDYPLRDLYQQVSGGQFLERCGRLWTSQASFPGPVAVRAGTRLSHCRQAEVPLFRVDFAAHNTDPWHPARARVDAVVEKDKGIAHLSWVRSAEQMREKATTSGYASQIDWPVELRRWEWRRRHPLLTVVTTPLQARRSRFRLTFLPVPG